MKGKELTGITEYISQKDRGSLEKLVREGCIDLESEPEYWVHGGDESLSYCHKCCEKEVERLRKENPNNDYCVDGGWGSEGDSIPHCETCGMLLENTLTDYGCEEEVDHFLEDGFDLKNKYDCHSMDLVIACRGWEPWPDQQYRTDLEKKYDLEYYEKLHRLCEKTLQHFRYAATSL